MQLRHLRYFVALGHEKHFGRAAEACHVTQSTLSAAVRQLENEIGAPLIERDKRFKGLTAEGKVLLGWAKRVVAEREALDQEIGLLRGELTGELTLGVIPSALPTVSLMTTPFSEAHPKVTLQILSRTSDQIHRALDAFDFDVGITYLGEEPLQGVRAYPLYEERYILLTPTRGPFRGRKSVTWQEAAQTPLCLLTPDMQNRRLVNSVFASVGCAPSVQAESNSLMTLCSHIRTGAWSSVLPHNLLWLFGTPKGMLALPLVEPERSFTVCMVVRQQKPQPPLVDAFAKSARNLDLEALIEPRQSARS